MTLAIILSLWSGISFALYLLGYRAGLRAGLHRPSPAAAPMQRRRDNGAALARVHVSRAEYSRPDRRSVLDGNRMRKSKE